MPFFYLIVAALYTVAAFAGDSAGPISAADAKKLRSPIPYSKESAKEGRQIFLRMCAGCHGNDAKSTLDVVADATDLTEPKAYKNGTSSGEMYRSIRDGQSASMPSFRTQVKSDEEMWHLVNFIQSLWPESQRPKESTTK